MRAFIVVGDILAVFSDVKSFSILSATLGE